MQPSLVDAATLEQLASVRHRDPHTVLGRHPAGPGEVVYRAWRPEAVSVALRCAPGAELVPLAASGPSGIFEARFDESALPLHPVVVSTYADGETFTAVDPWGFAPTLGPLDLHLFAEGRHRALASVLGANLRTHDGVSGVAFAVWAPNAARVSVVGDFNSWDGRQHPMRCLGESGVWELFIAGLDSGVSYQFELITAEGGWLRKADPLAKTAALRPLTHSKVAAPSRHVWGDAAWLSARAARDPRRSPMSVYELHPGSFARDASGRWLDWERLAARVVAHVKPLGFTHVELMGVSEHPFDGSWGYQVTGYFAPTSRFGSPDDFRAFVDHLHQNGLGVIVDWVPAHFPKDPHGLGRFDGTALYEHADPRQGEHPDWGTWVFNYGRNEVAGFLIASARYWVAEFHVDGLRVDAVASMLYLDYSRAENEWVPNRFGGRENLDAIAMLQQLNTVLHGDFEGIMVIAEESTAWPGVTRPVYAGGLGFTLKWNMGWMHDTLGYFARDPVHRRWHHHELTFGLVYQWSEQYVLALSHDEVVHLKRSLVGKMAGDDWQRRANLRALYSWMWCHPGKKLLFMGGEFGQTHEWDHQRGLDWAEREAPEHRGIEALVGDLNALYQSHPALSLRDDDPSHFRWVEAHDADHAVYAFLREGPSGEQLLCVLNATPNVRHGYALGVPAPGVWHERLNSDAAAYGGSNVGNHGRVFASPTPSHGLPHRVTLTLPPLGVLVLTSQGASRGP
ncbi:MAG: 1,4-alpha-glucan branching protein GlgB [Myxococcales bacterium]|nr:1,4-alpha-glucan branching protein GlgB [Myxococcales bacterium]